MGMGAARPGQQLAQGMGGKGGAARPQQSIQQPQQGMGGKGMVQQSMQQPMQQPQPQAGGLNNALMGLYGAPVQSDPIPQPPVQQPVAGMGGKGVGQPPAQQPNLNNALSGLAGAPVQTYPFPQPSAQQPVAGMSGKGVGQQVLPEYAQPYYQELIQQSVPMQPQVQPQVQPEVPMPPPKPVVQGPISSGGIPTPNNPILGDNTPQQDAMRQRFMRRFGQGRIGGAPFEQRISEEDQRQMFQRMLQRRGNR